MNDPNIIYGFKLIVVTINDSGHIRAIKKHLPEIPVITGLLVSESRQICDTIKHSNKQAIENDL